MTIEPSSSCARRGMLFVLLYLMKPGTIWIEFHHVPSLNLMFICIQLSRLSILYENTYFSILFHILIFSSPMCMRGGGKTGTSILRLRTRLLPGSIAGTTGISMTSDQFIRTPDTSQPLLFSLNSQAYSTIYDVDQRYQYLYPPDMQSFFSVFEPPTSITQQDVCYGDVYWYRYSTPTKASFPGLPALWS